MKKLLLAAILAVGGLSSASAQLVELSCTTVQTIDEGLVSEADWIWLISVLEEHYCGDDDSEEEGTPPDLPPQP